MACVLTANGIVRLASSLGATSVDVEFSDGGVTVRTAGLDGPARDRLYRNLAFSQQIPNGIEIVVGPLEGKVERPPPWAGK